MLNWKKSKKYISAALVFLTTALTINPVFAAGSNPVTPETQAAEIVSKMTLEEKVGQLLMPDFRNWNGTKFTVMNDEVKGVIQKYHLGGVILFAENVQGTEQTARLTDGLQQASPNIPLLLSIDQEGGSIVRLQTGTNMPGNMPLGATRDKDLTYSVGKAIGEELHSLGINTDFAPDMDVNINPDNPIIGIRSFGGNAQLVADFGVAYFKGLNDSGTIGTVKHFPGHGDVATDSHTGLPLVPYDMTRLKNVELKPFQAAIDNDVDMIMSAHIQFPAVDDTKVISKKDGSEIYLPATLSKKVLTDLVRGQMGYKGVIVTDALNMGAIADNFGKEDAVIRAINAGTDIALMPATVQSTAQIANLDSVFNAVVNAVNTGVIPQSRVDESATRIITLKIKRGLLNTDTRTVEEKVANALTVVGSPAHRAIETEAVNKSVTLMRDDNKMLPFKLNDNTKVVVISPFDDRNVLLETGVNEVAATNNLQGVTVTKFTTSGHAVPDNVKTAMLAADYVIFGSYIYNVSSRTVGSTYADYALDINNFANQNNIKIVNVSICYPYEPMYLNNAKTLINVYGRYASGANPALNLLGATRAIFGLINPTGKLPVDVPNPNDSTKNLYDFGYGLVYAQTAQDALAAVVKAETNFNKADVDAARTFLNTLPNYPEKADLLVRLTNVENSLNSLKNVTLTLDKTTVDRTKTASASLAGKLGSGSDVDLSTAKVEYFSTNPDVVSVDTKGVVTANKVGSADVKAVVTLNDKAVVSNTVTVTVNEMVMEISAVSFSLDKQIVERNETTTVTLMAKGAKDLYGFDTTFAYDTNLFTLEGVTLRDEFASAAQSNSFDVIDNNGSVRVVSSLIGATNGVTGDVPVLSVKLKAKDASGVAKINITKDSCFTSVEGALFTVVEDVNNHISVAPNTDITGDSRTMINDLVLVARAFGLKEGQTSYKAELDMNKDGVIDIADIAYIANKVLGR